MQQQISNDNHYVPQLYLKQWAVGGKISTYRLLVPHEKFPVWHDYPLKAIAFYRNLYTYVGRNGETDEFERWLDAEFENPAEEAINRAVSGQRLTPEHWRRLTRFALAQDVRTPARLREFLDRQQVSLPATMDESVRDAVRELESLAEGGVRPPAPSGSSDNPFPVNVSIKPQGDGTATVKASAVVGRGLWIWSLRHLLTQTVEKLPKYCWTILHAPVGVSWPTSDKPLVRFKFIGPGKYIFDGGWGMDGVGIIMPLGPKHLLCTQVGERLPRRGTVLAMSDAQLFRRMIIQHAHRYIFSRDPGDIQQLRPRKVCHETHEAEKTAWKDWNREQSEAEADLLRS